MRHAPFQIGPFERDAWLRCMHTAIASIDSDTLDDAHRKELLEYLEMDALSLSPIMVSPMADHGYDVADPRDVDTLFGGLAAFERLIAAAHERDIKITMDLVPNHTSSQHPWFRE